ncbi:MAG: hypothetical protein MK322_07190 [Pseudomonadales bacterium]|nr:hypothetical protein [Pseudomonadales bacterium]
MNSNAGTDASAMASVKTLAERYAQETESLGKLHPKVVRAVCDNKFPELIKPHNSGNLRQFIDTCSVIAEGCMSTGWCNFVWGMHNYLIALYPQSVQEKVWHGTDPVRQLVSASLGPAGKAIEERDSGLLVSGRWSFASGCDHAEWLLLGIKRDGHEPTLGLFRRKEVEIDDSSWQVIGLRGTGSKDVVANEVLVPWERLLSFSESLAPYAAMLILVIVGPVVGGAQGAVDHYQRSLQSMLHNVDDFSLKSAPHLLCLTKATAEVDTARTIVLAAADQLDINPTPDDYTTAKIVRDTAYAAQLSKRATQRVFDISGGSALKKSNPLQRFYRDVTAGCAHARLRWDEQALSFASLSLTRK